MKSKQGRRPLAVAQYGMLMLGKVSASKKTEAAVPSVNSGRPHPAVNWLKMATALVCPRPLSLRRPLNTHIQLS